MMMPSGTKVPKHRVLKRWHTQGLKCRSTDFWDEDTPREKY